MMPIDVLFLANVMERVVNKTPKMGFEGAMGFMIMELRTGVKEYQNGNQKALTMDNVKSGRVRGDRK